VSAGKDKIPMDVKAGIYEGKCNNKRCSKMYVGQTKRPFHARWDEHERAYRLKHPADSALAKHCLDKNHKLGTFKIMKRVTEEWKLDAWESIYMKRNEDDLVNHMEAPINSSLIDYVCRFGSLTV
jgi:hypothetical protein